MQDLLAASSVQVDESTKNLARVQSLLSTARSPRERTAVNIIRDDQRKVVKALIRLVNDLQKYSE